MVRVIFLFSVLSLILAGCGCSDEREKDGILDKMFSAKKKSVSVIVESAILDERTSDISLPVGILPSETVDVTIPQKGKIGSFDVEINDTVEKGDVLFRITEDEAKIKIASLRAELADAQTKLEKNSYYLRNKDRLYEEGRIDKTTYDNLETEVKSNETKLEEIQQKIKEEENLVSNAAVTAPTSGLVTFREGSTGVELPKDKIVIKIAKINPILISFQTTPKNAPTLQTGSKIKVLAQNTKSFLAEITSQKPTTKELEEFLTIEAKIDNPAGDLKPGMNATVTFANPEKKRLLLIPAGAVFKEEKRHYVYKVVDGVARKTPIMPSSLGGNTAEIAGGLNEGDIIVVRGQENLQEGASVNIWGK